MSCYLYIYTPFRLAQVLLERNCGLLRSVQFATSGHGNFGNLSTKLLVNTDAENFS